MYGTIDAYLKLSFALDSCCRAYGFTDPRGVAELINALGSTAVGTVSYTVGTVGFAVGLYCRHSRFLLLVQYRRFYCRYNIFYFKYSRFYCRYNRFYSKYIRFYCRYSRFYL